MIFFAVMVIVFVAVRVGMFVFVMMFVGVAVAVAMRVIVVVIVVVVMVVMVVIVFEMNIELHTFNRRLRSATKMQVIACDAELLQLMFECMKINTQVKQRADEHVAADAGKNIEIKCLHSRAARRLIWLAAKPAPNPLSMLTTVTPLPQLLSMVKSAERPPKFAP